MTIYTVEVGGRPVAAMQSTSLGEAEEFLRSDAFLNDLTIYEMEGGEPDEPMWDGEAEILVRESPSRRGRGLGENQDEGCSRWRRGP